MTAKQESATIVGVGVAACAACCTAPILGVLAAIGLGTAAGFFLIGAIAFLIGTALLSVVVLHRRRRATLCQPLTPGAVPIDLGERPTAQPKATA